MGFLDDLKKLTRPYNEDDEDDFDSYDDYEDEDPAVDDSAPAPRAGRGYGDKPTVTGDRRGNKVVNIHTTAQMQVVLVKPERFDTVSEIADHLRERRAVVLNLESANKDVARRLVDFLSGCAYALDGKIKKVALATYIITPYNVDIVGDLVEELENNGMYF